MEIIVSQQSKNIIPLPGNDGLDEEKHISQEAARCEETYHGFHMGWSDDIPRNPERVNSGISS